ncbi:hypothetical protein MRB53_027041 [Persea americana]|uniref:Uncharacterized protein n=1 Tax=Persea americana TaxID=3435 RepID=A0ACC2LJS2_PERAE|nr:hypothetical protein MRB53_027041 [Persea americana]
MQIGLPSFLHWVEPLLKEKFFNPCLLHETSKKNEKNIFCLDCCTSICPQCIHPHHSHPLLQIRRYVYHDVIRLDDLEKLIDCSFVQSYTTNSAKVLFLNRRPQSRAFRGSGNICSSCKRSLQHPYLFCSLSCKVQPLIKKKRLPSKYYQFLPMNERRKEEKFSLQIPPDLVLDSPILFRTSSSDGSWCKKLACMATPGFVKKKKRRSVLGLRTSFRPTCSPEMSVHLNRRKGIPQRSPLY